MFKNGNSLLYQWKLFRLPLRFGLCHYYCHQHHLQGCHHCFIITLRSCSLSGTLLSFFYALYHLLFNDDLYSINRNEMHSFYKWGNWGLENFSNLYKTEISSHISLTSYSVLITTMLQKGYRKGWLYLFLVLWLYE